MMANNNKKQIKTNWTDRENEFLGSMIVNLVNSGKKYREAYVEVAKTLNRTPWACEKQWRNLKPQYAADIVKGSKTTSAEEIVAPQDVIEVGTTEEAEKVIRQAEFGLNGSKLNGNKITEFNGMPLTDVLKVVTESFQSNQKETKKAAYEGREKVAPKEGTTKLAQLRKSIETFESEKFKVLNSGKKDLEYIVINNEEDYGYLVKVDADKVVSCNCPHHVYRGAICKHMLKVAFDKNLEVF